ncbi:MAG: metalloregulator ArsR/SmtB family transcription factor [Spirochaetia bacterium]|nr:metalloregulator ArsR/SmtB family transcription factor [Spirochaetia bacterium]
MQTIEYLKVFAEPLRIRILFLLKESSLTVSELVSIMGQSQSNISHHIKTLKDLNLIEFEKKGNLNLYKLIKKPDLPAVILGFWEKLSEIASELIETHEDLRKLVFILADRDKNNNSESWSVWRKAQPDLPYTSTVAFAGMPKANIAVDIGCGDGLFLSELKTNFNHLIGLDISMNQLAQAKKTVENEFLLVRGNALSLPFQSNSVCSVFFRMVLGFIKNPEKALDEAFKILRPGGRISIIDKIKPEEKYFSRIFFSKFCEDKPSLNLLYFREISTIFICSLEKL